MARLNNKLVAVAGLVAGAVTLRKLRNRHSRNSDTEDAPPSSATVAKEEARAAVDHARTAGEKAGEYARDRVRSGR